MVIGEDSEKETKSTASRDRKYVTMQPRRMQGDATICRRRSARPDTTKENAN